MKYLAFSLLFCIERMTNCLVNCVLVDFPKRSISKMYVYNVWQNMYKIVFLPFYHRRYTFVSNLDYLPQLSILLIFCFEWILFIYQKQYIRISERGNVKCVGWYAFLSIELFLNVFCVVHFIMLKTKEYFYNI